MTITYSAQSAAPQKTRTSLLPLLVVLFIASYAILTLLVVEQGRTIESQRFLLREMLKDSTQLADLKGKLARADAERAQTKPAPQVQAPAKEKPSGNSGSASPKAAVPEARRPSKSARTTKQVPGRPAEDLQDVRRSTNVI